MWRLFLLGLVLFWSFHLCDPHLKSVRDYEPLLLILLLALLVGDCVFRRKAVSGFLTLGVGVGCLIVFVNIALSIHARWFFYQDYMQTDPLLKQRINRHLIIGFDHIDEVRPLVGEGLAGLFYTTRNIAGRSLAEIGEEIALFQSLRRAAELPELFIATDQEGGAVSRFSPPLPLQPPLVSVVELSGNGSNEEEKKEIDREGGMRARAYAYGVAQGRALASVGVNLNFSPVVDLKPAEDRARLLDVHTQIAMRAIAGDPDTVGVVASEYSQALLHQGVTPVLKHFPGLGRVKDDTHHFAARLDEALGVLEISDFKPYDIVIESRRGKGVWMMLSHVVLSSLDADNPVSTSKEVVDYIRGRWGEDIVLITDDMSMSAVYDRGLCESSQQAVAAGVNYLLIAYDHEKFYEVFSCLKSYYENHAPEFTGNTKIVHKEYISNE